jgi:hypothetical protein
MKFNDVSFPHPVLGVGDAISGNIGFNPNPEIISEGNFYFITINCEHDNKDLDNLLKKDLVEFFCDVTCSNTLYRNSYRSSNNQIKFEIPKKYVKGKVILTCLLVAKTTITDYTNSLSNSDYEGYNFEIEPGDILAVFGKFDFDADIRYEKLKAVSTFMEVVENKDPDAVYTNYDFSKSKIEVQLPSEDYKTFANDSISKETKFVPVFHSSIVQNALISALYNIKAHKDCLWAKVIEYRLRNEKQFEPLSIEENEDIPEIAQRLLGNPFRRLISELQVFVDLSIESEEY